MKKVLGKGRKAKSRKEDGGKERKKDSLKKEKKEDSGKKEKKESSKIQEMLGEAVAFFMERLERYAAYRKLSENDKGKVIDAIRDMLILPKTKFKDLKANPYAIDIVFEKAKKVMIFDGEIYDYFDKLSKNKELRLLLRLAKPKKLLAYIKVDALKPNLDWIGSYSGDLHEDFKAEPCIIASYDSSLKKNQWKETIFASF